MFFLNDRLSPPFLTEAEYHLKTFRYEHLNPCVPNSLSKVLEAAPIPICSLAPSSMSSTTCFPMACSIQIFHAVALPEWDSSTQYKH